MKLRLILLAAADEEFERFVEDLKAVKKTARVIGARRVEMWSRSSRKA